MAVVVIIWAAIPKSGTMEVPGSIVPLKPNVMERVYKKREGNALV